MGGGKLRYCPNPGLRQDSHTPPKVSTPRRFTVFGINEEEKLKQQIEMRPYTPQEIDQLRQEYGQNGRKGAFYRIKLWGKETDTAMLLELDTSKSKNI